MGKNTKQGMNLLKVQPTEHRLMALGTQLTFMERLFLEHQWALMEQRWETALERFEQVYECRTVHLDFMENRLLPLFEKYIHPVPHGARLRYFKREAAQIRKRLKPYIRLLSRLYQSDAMKQLDLARLFDEYMLLKDLLDHHDTREKVFLFPLLDTKLNATDRWALLNIYRARITQLEERWRYV